MIKIRILKKIATLVNSQEVGIYKHSRFGECEVVHKLKQEATK